MEPPNKSERKAPLFKNLLLPAAKTCNPRYKFEKKKYKVL
jgi:hypothetical protein